MYWVTGTHFRILEWWRNVGPGMSTGSLALAELSAQTNSAFPVCGYEKCPLWSAQNIKKTLAMEMSWLFIFMAEVVPIQWFNSHTYFCSVTQGVQTFFLSLSWTPEKELGLYSGGFFPTFISFFFLSFSLREHWNINVGSLCWCVLLLWALWPSERSCCVNSRNGKRHFIFLVYV